MHGVNHRFLTMLVLTPSVQWLISAGTATSFIADSLLTGVLVTLLRKEQKGSDRYAFGFMDTSYCLTLLTFLNQDESDHRKDHVVRCQHRCVKLLYGSKSLYSSVVCL